MLLLTTLMTVLVMYSIIIKEHSLSAQSISNYNELSKQLLADYNKNTLPTNDRGKALQVSIQAYLLALGDLNEIDERLSTVMGFDLLWRDDSMVWNVTDHHGIERIVVDEGETWTPFLSLANMHHYRSPYINDETEKVVYLHNGDARWTQVMPLDSTCDLDITKFPFDHQVCEIKFNILNGGLPKSIWTDVTYNDSLIYYTGHSSWHIYDSLVKGGHESKFTITFLLKRKPLFMLMSVLLPSFVLSFLAPLVFVLPNDTGERAAYSITTLMAVSVQMIIISSNLPHNSKPMPLVTIMMFIWYISNAVIVLIVSINTKLFMVPASKPVPGILQHIAHKTCFAKFFSIPKHKQRTRGKGSFRIREQLRHTCKRDMDVEPEVINSKSSRCCVWSFKRIDKKIEAHELSGMESYRKKSTNEDILTVQEDKPYDINDSSEPPLTVSLPSETVHHVTWRDVTNAIDLFCLIIFYTGKFLFLIVVLVLICSV